MTEASLTEAAMAALALRPYTRAGLKTLLKKRIASWARREAKTGRGEDDLAAAVARAEQAASALCERLVASQVVDDAAFVEHRTARLTREGKSRRAIEMHLVQKGAPRELARRGAQEGADDLYAAVVLARKRRLGPFARDEERTREEEAKHRNKQLATFARAGFGMSTAQRVLRMSSEEATDLLASRRAL